MAKLTTLTHLENLANKVKESCASKTEFNELKSTAQTAEQVRAIVTEEAAKFAQPSFKKVDSLPPYSDAEDGIFYLIKENSKYWSIYAKVTGEESLIKLDETEIDLEKYTTDEELETALADYVKSAELDEKLKGYAKTSDIETLTAQLGNKVDKNGNKQLSTEDFTTALKTKLEAIPDGIEIASDEEVGQMLTRVFGS